ncbi:MAG: PTS sugar transporter subunit IIC [Nitrospirota bacterium]
MVDLQTVVHVLLIAVIGGVVGLDRTAVGQFMISQPIVAGPLTGWLLGDVNAGFVIGAVLELIWVMDMPVGNFVPADSTVAAVSATAIAALAGQGNAPLSVVGFSIFLTVFMAPLTMVADGILRKRNERLAELAAAGEAEKADRNLERAHRAGLVAFFLKYFVLYLLFVPAGLAGMHLFFRMPGQFHNAMALFVKLLPLLGAASVACKLSVSTVDRFLLAGFLIAAVSALAFGVSMLVITLMVISAGWVGVRYSDR